MVDETRPPADPGVQDIILAFAQSLLPLMGKDGIKIANLVPATSAMLMLFQNFGKVNYTAEDLQGVIAKNTVSLEVLNADIDKMPDDKP
jgi:hypothetical protein